MHGNLLFLAAHDPNFDRDLTVSLTMSVNMGLNVTPVEGSET